MKTYFNGMLEIDDNEELHNIINKLSYAAVVDLLYMILNQEIIRNGGYSIDEGYIIHECFRKIRENEKDLEKK